MESNLPLEVARGHLDATQPAPQLQTRPVYWIIRFGSKRPHDRTGIDDNLPTLQDSESGFRRNLF
jgi:hypothetical protein